MQARLPNMPACISPSAARFSPREGRAALPTWVSLTQSPATRLRAPGTFLRPSLAAISSTTSAFGSSRSSKLFWVPICRGIKGSGRFRGAGWEKQPSYSAPFLAQLSPKNTSLPLAKGSDSSRESPRQTDKTQRKPLGLFPSQAASRFESRLRENVWRQKKT